MHYFICICDEQAGDGIGQRPHRVPETQAVIQLGLPEELATALVAPGHKAELFVLRSVGTDYLGQQGYGGYVLLAMAAGMRTDLSADPPRACS